MSPAAPHIAKGVLDLIAALSAFGAAAFWFYSARLPILTPGSYWDKMSESDPWLQTTRKSAKLNKWAALFAGISALSTFLSWFLGFLQS